MRRVERPGGQLWVNFGLALVFIAGIWVIGLIRFADDIPDVADRAQGRGIRQGQFWVLPEVDSGLLIDTNVRATPGGTRDDEAFFITPNVKVKSDFGRHEVAAEAAIKHVEYFSLSPESRTEAFGKVQSRIDITRDLNAYLTAKGGVFR